MKIFHPDGMRKDREASYIPDVNIAARVELDKTISFTDGHYFSIKAQ